MKRYILILVFIGSASYSFTQTKSVNSHLIRQDTSLLKATECDWNIKSLAENNPAIKTETGKSVPLVLLQAIQNGKLKAIDLETNKPIPAMDIFTWQMGVDTMAQYDAVGNITKYVAVKHSRSSKDISQIRVFQDWYLDMSTGRLQSVIKSIELLEEIHTSYSGIFIGYKPLCRIYY